MVIELNYCSAFKILCAGFCQKQIFAGEETLLRTCITKAIGFVCSGRCNAVRAYTIEHGGFVKFVAGDISSLVLPLSAK
ncbi:MAG: hypothetical protein R2847_05090 [Bacteroidia bacterium]